jgi:hypothetical protein
MVANPQVSTCGNIALKKVRKLTAEYDGQSGDPGRDLYGASVDRSSSWKILVFSGMEFQSWYSEKGRFKVIQDNLQKDNINVTGKDGGHALDRTGMNISPEVTSQESTLDSPEEDGSVPVLLPSSESDGGQRGESSDPESSQNSDSSDLSSSSSSEEEEDAGGQEDDPPPPPPVPPDAPPPEGEVSLSMLYSGIMSIRAQLDQMAHHFRGDSSNPMSSTSAKRKKSILVEDDSDEMPLETLKERSTAAPSSFPVEKSIKSAVRKRRTVAKVTANESIVTSSHHPLEKLPKVEPPKKKVTQKEMNAIVMSPEEKAFAEASSYIRTFEASRRKSMLSDKAEKKAPGSNPAVPGPKGSGVDDTKAYSSWLGFKDDRLQGQYRTILTILENPGKFVCYHDGTKKKNSPWDGFHMVGCAGPLSLWDGEPPSFTDFTTEGSFTTTTPYVLEDAEALSFIESFLLISGLPKIRGGMGRGRHAGSCDCTSLVKIQLQHGGRITLRGNL